ncbi:NAD(P)H-dependent flavin oxidoreductase [Fictibacillus gelatini]|uniref:NAD(P)H-dependent flavin oxidoreductase n=1 Tax=Fictibacillus gelatini TaxID=225985 RepID=UPI0004251F3A|nr:nitronate monooxygenase [Fictibacillus gelatini]
MDQRLCNLVGIQYPIVQAGMAGGPTTPELVAAVSKAGGLGTLGAGYMNAVAIKESIKKIKELTDQPFAVNLFLPEEFVVDRQQIHRMQERLNTYREKLDLPLSPQVSKYGEDFQEQLEAVIESDVKIISFTFNCPSQTIMNKLKQHGITVIGTATTVKEAAILEEVGVDAIVAQGSEAGGHRGTFIGREEEALIGTIALVPQIVDKVNVPVIAAGGIMNGRGLVASLALGAAGVQVGTAFLTAEESGARQLHQQAILECEETDLQLTRAFSGKMARGIRNSFMAEMEKESDLPPYPVQNALTNDIRKASAAKKNREYVHMWAGQAAPMSKKQPAARIIETIMSEAKTIVHGIRF